MLTHVSGYYMNKAVSNAEGNEVVLAIPRDIRKGSGGHSPPSVLGGLGLAPTSRSSQLLIAGVGLHAAGAPFHRSPRDSQPHRHHRHNPEDVPFLWAFPPLSGCLLAEGRRWECGRTFLSPRAVTPGPLSPECFIRYLITLSLNRMRHHN